MLREAFYEHSQYKAKVKDTGEWVEGFYSAVTDNFTPANIHFITEFQRLENGEIVLTESHEVLPETLCRNTGARDKNGKHIWEYDICDCPKRGPAFTHCIVVYNPVKARFEVRTTGTSFPCSFPMMLDQCVDDISINGLDYEVIGNFIDNPEWALTEE